LALLADGAARLLVAAPLVFFASTGLAAAALVAAGLAGAVVPLYIGRARLRKVFDGSGGAIFGLRDAASFAAPAVVIAGADQLLVNGGPVLVAVSGGGAGKAAGVVFAATMLVRAPVYVFQGLASAILPNLTRLHARDDSASFVDAVHRATAVLVGAGAVIVASVAIAGPAAMALYGSDYRASRSALVLLAVGVACYLAAGTFSQALLSVDGGRRAAVAWVAAGAVLITYYASSAGSPLGRVSAAFACAMATLVVLTAGLFAMKVRQR
jgi:O-antigen/teichoic acid export membrane protein